MGSAPSSGSARVGARQGGARCRCRQVFLAGEVQQLNIGALILGHKGAQCVEREVVGFGFSRRRSCAEELQPSAKWAGMQLRDARAAKPVQLLGAAAAKVMPKEQGIVIVDFFPADAALVPRPLRIWGFTGRHPEERYRFWDNRDTLRECARYCAVRCGG